VTRLEELKVEMDEANREYAEALAQAGQLEIVLHFETQADELEELLKELQQALGTSLGQGTQTDLTKAISSLST
jgi:exonuclease VII small subunit